MIPSLSSLVAQRIELPLSKRMVARSSRAEATTSNQKQNSTRRQPLQRQSQLDPPGAVMADTRSADSSRTSSATGGSLPIRDQSMRPNKSPACGEATRLGLDPATGRATPCVYRREVGGEDKSNRRGSLRASSAAHRPAAAPETGVDVVRPTGRNSLGVADGHKTSSSTVQPADKASERRQRGNGHGPFRLTKLRRVRTGSVAIRESCATSRFLEARL